MALNNLYINYDHIIFADDTSVSINEPSNTTMKKFIFSYFKFI